MLYGCDGVQYGTLRGIMRRLSHLPHPIATFTSNTYCANIDIRSGGTWPEKKGPAVTFKKLRGEAWKDTEATEA